MSLIPDSRLRRAIRAVENAPLDTMSRSVGAETDLTRILDAAREAADAEAQDRSARVRSYLDDLSIDPDLDTARALARILEKDADTAEHAQEQYLGDIPISEIRELAASLREADPLDEGIGSDIETLCLVVEGLYG